jgi:hypothetical protein
VKRILIVPALALIGFLPACSDISNSGSAGVAGRSDVGVSNASAGRNNIIGSSAQRQASSYQNELRAENSN